MEKLKKNYLTRIIMFLGIAVISFATVILSGCSQIFALSSVVNDGYVIDRMIYTDNPGRYLDLSSINSEEEPETEGAVIQLGNTCFSYYVVNRNAESNIVDIVFDTRVYDESWITPQLFYTKEIAYKSLSQVTYLDGGETVEGGAFISNRYMFSDYSEFLDIGYTTKCTFEGCVGEPWASDSDNDHRCTCSVSIPADVDYATYDEAVEAVACECLYYTITEVSVLDETTQENVTLYRLAYSDRPEGATEYDVWSACKCDMTAEYTGEMGVVTFPVSAAADGYTFTYNELIIDGYDMSFINQVNDAYKYFEKNDISSYVDFTDYSHMFDSILAKKITINNMYNLGLTDENAVKNLSYMFANCTNLESIDFGNFFDGLQPADISYMFYNCPRLRYVNLSGLDTSAVVNMENMFSDKELTSTETVRNMYLTLMNMFENGTTNTYVDVEYYANKLIMEESELSELYMTDPDRAMAIAEAYVIFNNKDNDYYKFAMTYDEIIALGTGAKNMTELLELVNADPELAQELGLPAQDTPYTEAEIISVIETYETELDVSIMSTEELEQISKEYFDSFDNKRDIYLNVLLDYMLAKDSTLPQDDRVEPWTMSDYVDYLLATDTTIPEEYINNRELLETMVRVELLSKALSNNLYTYMTYDEYACLVTEGEVLTLAELVELSNAEEGTSYTLEEAMAELDALVSDAGYVEMGTASEIEEMFRTFILDARVTLEAGSYTEYTYEYLDREQVLREKIANFYKEGTNSVAYKPSSTTALSRWDVLAMELINDTTNNAKLNNIYKSDPDRALFMAKSTVLYTYMKEAEDYSPMTYDEMSVIAGNYFFGSTFMWEIASLDELVFLINLEMSGDERISKQMVILMIQEFLFQINFSDEENPMFLSMNDEQYVDNYFYTMTETECEMLGKTIILGGEGSKFVIKEGTNVTNMFGTNVSTILSPVVEAGVFIALPKTYNDTNENLEYISSATNNKLLSMGELVADPTPDITPSNEINWLVISIVSGAIIVLGLAVGCAIKAKKVYFDKKKLNAEDKI